MPMVHVAASGSLPSSVLSDIRSLLEHAFDGDFTDEDWAHALGGVHVWVTGPSGVISHASLVERTLVCSGRALQVGYVEAVATAATYRRQGHGTTVMQEIGARIRERYALGALSTGTHAFYRALGWEEWRGSTFVDSPLRRERTPDDDGDIMILRTAQSPGLDLDGDITCDWRSGDVW